MMAQPNYDAYGRVTNKVDAASTNIFRYGYDPNSRLTNRWTAAKGTTVYRYGPVGNLTNVDYAVSPDITLQYDALNRLTNMVDAVGTTVYGYDAAGLLLNEDGPWAGDTELRLQQPVAHQSERVGAQRLRLGRELRLRRGQTADQCHLVGGRVRPRV